MLTRALAISTLPSASLKRRYEAPIFEDVDSENVDPSVFCSPTKKNKIGLQERVQPPKAANFVMNSFANTVKSSLGRPVRSARRSDPIATRSHQQKLEETPTTPVYSITSLTPRNIDSAPAVAGRSPKSKRVGILSRRRMTTIPFTRVNPPSLSSNGIYGGLPFSIDAALSGTIPSYRANPVQVKEVKPKEFPTLEESVPQGWIFDIYEETEEMQEQNVVVHRACNLDISDDESIAGVKADRGKENIPPSDTLSTNLIEITTAIPASRKNMMTDEPRTPLGDLEASDFYAEGCDASSYIIIPGESSLDQNDDKPCVGSKSKEDYSLPRSHAPELVDGWTSSLSQVEASKQSSSSSHLYDSHFLEKVEMDSAPMVEIWESESAKDEDEARGLDQVGQHLAWNAEICEAD